MVLMAGGEVPLGALRGEIASAFEGVGYMGGFLDRSRMVTSVAELLGMEDEIILLQNIFQIEQVERDGRQVRELRPQGLRPMAMKKLERANHYMPADFFEASPFMTLGSRL